MNSDVKSNGKLRGKVIWFNADKGYGFLEIDGDPDNLFIHATDLVRSGLEDFETKMKPGKRVLCRKMQSKKDPNKFCATDVEMATP